MGCSLPVCVPRVYLFTPGVADSDVQGALEVVQQMGYSEAAEYGLQFARDEPDPAATSNMVVDIILARTEMERYLMNKHPHPETIHAYMPESTM